MRVRDYSPLGMREDDEIMKMERAQELYSDYAEDSLTPALRLALEQHFDADPAARADYDRFARVFALMERPLEEVEVPLGFRAKILEKVAQEQAKRDTSFSQRASDTFAGWFSLAPRRRATGGVFAALAAVVIGGIVVLHPGHGSGFGGDSIPIPTVTTVMPEMLQKVDVKTLADNNDYHTFHLHLPAAVPAATVSAYVVTATEQITDPAHLNDATVALPAQHLNNRQGVQIPIAAAQATPAGSTLNLLVKWTPDDTKQEAGSEVIFTPFGAADPATTAPTNADFLDAMQKVAAHYGVTVVLEADAVPTQTATADFSDANAATPLTALAKTAGYAVQALPGGTTYYVYDPQQAH